MSDVLPLSIGASGLTLYGQVRDGASIWNTANTAFESYDAGKWGKYGIAVNEQGSSGIYTVAFPGDIAAGRYTITIFEQAGGSPAEGDPPVWHSEIDWNGSDVIGSNDVIADQLTQSDILSDATPFAGANIDAAITSRTAPSDSQTIDMAQSLPGTPTADTTGQALADADDNLDAAISTRSQHSALDVTGGTDVATAESNLRGTDNDDLKTLSDQIDTVTPVGTGATVVDDGTVADDGDDLRYLDAQGNGIGDATVQAFLQSDFNNSNFVVRGSTNTKDDGTWATTMNLSQGLTYVIRFEKPGVFGPDTQVLTV